jgi:hypothetical protein
MSGSIPTPSSARLPDSPTGYQYLVEKMRIAAEWRPSDYIPVYKQGDIVLYETNMYIKKNGNNNTLISNPPSLNTKDWLSLENYIKNISSNNLGRFSKTTSNIPDLDNYLNSITDVTDISSVNLAAVGYIITKYLGKGDGMYNFTLVANNPGTADGYYFVNYSRTNGFFSTAISYGDKNPKNLFISSANGATGTKNVSTNVIQQLGYTPAKIDGTNWSTSAVATSLGYSPAKIGDSWISSKFYYNGTAWTFSNALASSPDLVSFTAFVGTFGAETFNFGLRKGSNKVETNLYNVSVTPYFTGTGTVGPSAFYFRESSSDKSYLLLGANVYLSFGSGNAVGAVAIVPFVFNITFFFSKNL